MENLHIPESEVSAGARRALCHAASATERITAAVLLLICIAAVVLV
jgi:hypothetical protein